MSERIHYSEVDGAWLADYFGFCLCFSVIPLRSGYATPSPHCPVHKTLAARWDSIKSWKEFDAALAADYRPEWSTRRRAIGQPDPWAKDKKDEQ